MQRKARIEPFALIGVVISCALVTGCIRRHGAVVPLVQTIPLPGVEGRIDHFSVDLAGKRLFLCALGNNSVEVIDLQKGERVHSIVGLGAPQGVAYAADDDRLYVANDKAGLCNIFDGKSYELAGLIDLKDDADNVRYDEGAKRLYVGYGTGGLATIDGTTGNSVGSVELCAHPEAFVLEKEGVRIFVNVPTARHVAVVDRAKGKVLATWGTGDASANFPMALDEPGHRLFVGCRSPATLVVLDTDSGKVAATVPISGDVDDVFYDGKRRRLYAITGQGSIDVIEQTDRDTYKMREKIRTAPGARTGLYVSELSSLFVAVPHRGSQPAEVRRYEIH